MQRGGGHLSNVRMWVAKQIDERGEDTAIRRFHLTEHISQLHPRRWWCVVPERFEDSCYGGAADAEQQAGDLVHWIRVRKPVVFIPAFAKVS